MLDMGIISRKRFKPDTDAAGSEEEKELARKAAHLKEYNMYHKEGMEELLGIKGRGVPHLSLFQCIGAPFDLLSSGNPGH
ncbi:MAG: hypothetical protein ACLUV8_13135 [Clostridium sp.]